VASKFRLQLVTHIVKENTLQETATYIQHLLLTLRFLFRFHKIATPPSTDLHILALVLPDIRELWRHTATICNTASIMHQSTTYSHTVTYYMFWSDQGTCRNMSKHVSRHLRAVVEVHNSIRTGRDCWPFAAEILGISLEMEVPSTQLPFARITTHQLDIVIHCLFQVI